MKIPSCITALVFLIFLSSGESKAARNMNESWILIKDLRIHSTVETEVNHGSFSGAANEWWRETAPVNDSMHLFINPLQIMTEPMLISSKEELHERNQPLGRESSFIQSFIHSDSLSVGTVITIRFFLGISSTAPTKQRFICNPTKKKIDWRQQFLWINQFFFLLEMLLC